MSTYEQKVRQAFRFFDLNGDGFVSREELVKTADIISSLGKTTEPEAEEIRHQWTKWADVLFPEGPATEDLLYERNIKFITEDRETYNTERDKTFQVTFDRIDGDRNGFISMDELLLFYKAFGYNDKSFVEKVFKSIDENHDGLISKKEFVDAHAVYWSPEPGFEFLYDIPQKRGVLPIDS